MESELYPNQPLIEVIFEIRFPGEPAVECRRDNFYNLIRGKYPKVYVPKLKAGQSPALAPYNFKTADDQDSLMTAINRFAYSTKKYPGFHEFKPEALRVTRLFAEEFKLDKVHRTGLRYINLIPFVRESGIIPIYNFFRMQISLPEAISSDFSSLKLAFVSRVEGGSMTMRIEHIVAEDKSQEALLLDFDFAKEDALRADGIEEYLEESHTYTKRQFETLITEEYRRYIRGEAI